MSHLRDGGHVVGDCRGDIRIVRPNGVQELPHLFIIRHHLPKAAEGEMAFLVMLHVIGEHVTSALGVEGPFLEILLCPRR